PLELLAGSAAWAPAERSTTWRLDYLIDAAAPSVILIGQLYLPGWRVSLDGGALPETALRGALHADGRMTVRVEPGQHRLQAWYDGPPGWRWRTVFVLGVTGVCALWLVPLGRSRRR